MPNDITVTKNTTSGSERWDIQYTADQAGTIDKTLLTAGKLMDRNEKVSITIPNGSATTPATTITPNNITISVNSSTGLITASNTQKTQNITPTISAGYVSSGTAGTITVSAKSATSQLSTQAGATITPTTSNQTAVAAGKYTLGAITVAGDANLVPANIANGVPIFGVVGTHQGGSDNIPNPLYINLVPLKTVSSGGNLEPYAVTNWFRTYRSSVLRALVDDKEEFLIPQYLPAGGGDFVAGRQAWCGDTVQIEFDELEFSYVYFTGSGTHTIQIDAIEKFKALTRSQTVTTSSNGGHPNGGICAQLISAWDEKPYIYSISQIPSKLYVVVSNNGVNTTYVLPSSLYQGYYGWGELNGDEEPDFTNFPVYIAFGNLNGNSGELYVFTETTSTITILTAIPEYMSASGVYF